MIIYGTIEGQTRKISRFMENVLQEENHQVAIANVVEDPPSPKNFDSVFIGSSIHISKYNSLVKKYVQDNVKILNEKPTAFFSVSMAIASDIKEEHEEVAQIANSFLKETKWNANVTWQIAGALKYTKYDYFKKLIMRSIAKKEGGSVDTSQDYEYTDWPKVKEQVLNFINSLKT